MIAPAYLLWLIAKLAVALTLFFSVVPFGLLLGRINLVDLSEVTG